MLDLELRLDGAAGTFGRRPGGRSDHQEDAVVPGEVDLGIHLRPVEGALGDEVVPVAPEREHVRGEADAELGGEGRGVAHPVHGEPDEDDVGAAVGDELLDRLAVDVVLELLLLDLDADDLLHALDVHLVGDRAPGPWR